MELAERTPGTARPKPLRPPTRASTMALRTPASRSRFLSLLGDTAAPSDLCFAVGHTNLAGSPSSDFLSRLLGQGEKGPELHQRVPHKLGRRLGKGDTDPPMRRWERPSEHARMP